MTKVMIEFVRAPAASETDPEGPQFEAGEIVSLEDASAQRWLRRGAAKLADKGARAGKAKRAASDDESGEDEDGED